MSVVSAISCGTSLLLCSAQVTAQFAPVPWLAPAIGALNTLIAMIEQIIRHALRQLQDRCISFLSVVQKTGVGASVQEQQRLVAGVQFTLRSIIDRIDRWCSKSWFYCFVKQADLATAIRDCHMEINDCLTKLQVTTAIETASWQFKFKANYERDRAEILHYLSDINNTQSITAIAQRQDSTDIKAIMNFMQENLSVTPSRDTRGLGTNLYHIQKSTGKLLANEEKVAIKVPRAVHSTPKSLRRFKREVDIWKQVWETDQGRHILPLYGFCQNDGPFPYVVSPWHPNGTADEYVRRYADFNHLALIRGISAGVRVLHTMNPPIVHGDLKGANIVIDSEGNPLLADFGFSRVMEDITGVPFTQYTEVSNSQRWLAPELCSEKGRLTMAADIYAYGMTILELMTHEKPWATIKHTLTVVIKVASGEKPPRSCDQATIARGLDHLWDVMQKCWGDAETRPTIAEVMQMLEH